MNEKNKTRSDAGTSRRVESEKDIFVFHSNQLSFAPFNFNSDRAIGQTKSPKEVLALIPCGENHAISMRALSELLGVDMRTLRKIIAQERIEGVLICSSSAGYFYPCCEAEKARFIMLLKARCRLTLRTLKILKSAPIPALDGEGSDGKA